MIILGILVFGLAIGALAQWLLGRHSHGIDWGMALVAGLGGSFVGGLIGSLISGDGLDLRPSGIIGSLVGALIVTAIWQGIVRKRTTKQRAATAKAARSGRHH